MHFAIPIFGASFFPGGVRIRGVRFSVEETVRFTQPARDDAMSAAFRRLSPFVITALIVLPVAVQGQSGDRLEQIKRLNRVAAQKAEADIRAAVQEALPLIKSNASGALEVLEAALHTAGSLRHGSRIWVLAKLNREPLVIAEGDTVEKFLLLSHGHDGSIRQSVRAWQSGWADSEFAHRRHSGHSESSRHS